MILARPKNFPILMLWLAVAMLTAMAVPSAASESEEIGDVQVGARALSRAFRTASAKATPSVVTVFAYGQGSVAAQPDSQRQLAPRAPGDRRDEDDPDEPQDPGADEQNDPQDPVGPTPPPRTGPGGQPLEVTGLGSGVILSDDGLIITNDHVVAQAERVVVQLLDQTEWEAVRVRGDPHSDVAILRIDSSEPLVPATVGDSDLLEIGDWVLAIGSPFKLEATVSAGIISAKNRAIRGIRRGRLLQTDAAINPGNSGGALIDLDGNVVAINTAIATRSGTYQGIGFAIPINQARWIAEELDQHGRVRRAALGIRLADLNKRIARQLNLQTGQGVLVYQLIDQSAADQAGLQPLDVIVEFAGQRVRRASDLQELVERQPVGSQHPVTVLRDGEEIELDVSLAPIEDPTAVD